MTLLDMNFTWFIAKSSQLWQTWETQLIVHFFTFLYTTYPILQHLIVKPYYAFRYVDSQRSVAVSLGGPNCDLKEAIDQSGLSLFSSEPTAGAPSDTMYLKQGEHLMKKGVYAAALYYLNMALKLNPESKVKQWRYWLSVVP